MQMMEVARILGEKANSGSWRPRRTIMFVSWAAEEYGLVGSKEFVEDFARKLEDRAVVYVNTDNCASGDVLWASASPTVGHKAIEATKMVPAPYEGNEAMTYYDYLVDW